MQKTDTAELRRLWAKAEAVGGDGRDLAIAMNTVYLALPAMLDELEAAREDLKATKATIRIMDQSIEGLESALGKECNVPQGEAVWKWLLKRDRRMKAIGAAEELEKAAKEEWQVASDGGNPILIVGRLQQRAAMLRQEAEGK